jgi:hypothetical protein
LDDLYALQQELSERFEEASAAIIENGIPAWFVGSDIQAYRPIFTFPYRQRPPL